MSNFGFSVVSTSTCHELTLETRVVKSASFETKKGHFKKSNDGSKMLLLHVLLITVRTAVYQ